jgi:MFS family permease
MIALLLMTSLTAVQQLMAFQTQDTFRLSPAESADRAGQLLAVSAATMLIAQWTIASSVRWISTAAILAMGAMLGCVSMLLIVYGVVMASLTAFYISSALFGVAVGLLLPTNAAALSLAQPENAQGQVAGLLAAAQGSGGILGPLLSTTLYGWSSSSPYWLAAAAFAAILYLGVAQSALRLERTASLP